MYFLFMSKYHTGVPSWAPFLWLFRDRDSVCFMAFLSRRFLYSFPFSERGAQENGGQYVGDFYGLGLEVPH